MRQTIRFLVAAGALLIAGCSKPAKPGGTMALAGRPEALHALQRPSVLVAPGTELSWRNFPANCVFRRPGGGDSYCSCVVVGTEAAITAGHCVNQRGTIKLERSRHSATCTKDPRFDLAVCKVDPPVPSSQVPFENLNQSAVLTSGLSVLVTGFGCFRLESPGTDPILGGGRSQISSPPGPGSSTVRLGAGSHPCRGDSGGPTYLLLGGSAAGTGRRLVAGINERNFNLTSVSSTGVQGFLGTWATANNAPICGVTPGAAGCRPL